MKRYLKIFSMLLVVCLFSVVSYAKEFDFKPTPEEKTVNPGESVEIILTIENIEDIDEGINTIVGNLTYEEKLFETMELVGKDKWTVTYNNDKENDLYGKFAVTTMQNGVEENQEVAVLRLKLKGDLPEGETEINFENIVSSDGYISIEDDDRVVKLIIRKEQSKPKPKPNNQPENKEEIETPSEEIEEDRTPDENKEEVQEEKENILTGDNIYLYVGIITIAIIVICVVVVYTRKKDKEGK